MTKLVIRAVTEGPERQKGDVVLEIENNQDPGKQVSLPTYVVAILPGNVGKNPKYVKGRKIRDDFIPRIDGLEHRPVVLNKYSHRIDVAVVDEIIMAGGQMNLKPNQISKIREN